MEKVIAFQPSQFTKAEYHIRGKKGILMTALKNIKGVREGGFSTTLIFQSASEDLRDDEEVLLQAIQTYETPEFLEYASEGMGYSRRVMTDAVRKFKDGLKYASDSLRSDGDFVFTAAQYHPTAIEYASPEIQQGWVMLAKSYILRF